MLKIKNKLGFTLVELIVVMAIIAILAAITVPTSIHFVKKANIAKEMQEMNASDSIQAVLVKAQSDNIDITETTPILEDRFTYNLSKMELPYTHLGIIEIVITGETDNWDITFYLKGQEYGSEANGSILSCTIPPKFKDIQIFKGSTKIPTNTKKFVYIIDKNNGNIVLKE